MPDKATNLIVLAKPYPALVVCSAELMFFKPPLSYCKSLSLSGTLPEVHEKIQEDIFCGISLAKLPVLWLTSKPRKALHCWGQEVEIEEACQSTKLREPDEEETVKEEEISVLGEVS